MSSRRQSLKKPTKTKVVTLKFTDKKNILKLKKIVDVLDSNTDSTASTTATTITTGKGGADASVAGTPAPATPAPSTTNNEAETTNGVISVNINPKSLPMNPNNNDAYLLDRTSKKPRKWSKKPREIKSFTGFKAAFASWYGESTGSDFNKSEPVVKGEDGVKEELSV